MSTCLIVAFYVGNRESCSFVQAQTYMDIQLKILNKLKHNLSKIVFVISSDSASSPELQIKEENNITYISRRNHAFSFGAWFDAIKYFKDAYDYYILCEDDYVFIKDNFDSILIDEYNTKNFEYMSTYQHASGAISTIGILSKDVAKSKDYFKNVCFTNSSKSGSMSTFWRSMNIESISKSYNAFPYWGYQKNPNSLNVYLYGCSKEETKENIKNRVLLCCIQMIDEQSLEINMNKPFFVYGNNDWIPYE
jgi:hypothetical protein